MKKIYIVELFGENNLKEKPWYSKNWTRVIRFKSVEMGYRFFKFIEKVSTSDKIIISDGDTNLFTILRKNKYDIFETLYTWSDLTYNYDELLTCAFIYSGLEEVRFFKGDIRSKTELIENLIESNYVNVIEDDKTTKKPQFLSLGDILINPDGDIAIVISQKEVEQIKEEIPTLVEEKEDKKDKIFKKKL